VFVDAALCYPHELAGLDLAFGEYEVPAQRFSGTCFAAVTLVD
jgi:hypothetical protein